MTKYSFFTERLRNLQYSKGRGELARISFVGANSDVAVGNSRFLGSGSSLSSHQ